MKRSVEMSRASTSFRKTGGVSIAELAGGQAFPRGGLHVFERVLVSSGQEKGVVAQEPAPPGNRVGLYEFQRKAHVGASVDVGDGGRYIGGVHDKSFP